MTSLFEAAKEARTALAPLVEVAEARLAGAKRVIEDAAKIIWTFEDIIIHGAPRSGVGLETVKWFEAARIFLTGPKP